MISTAEVIELRRARTRRDYRYVLALRSAVQHVEEATEYLRAARAVRPPQGRDALEVAYWIGIDGAVTWQGQLERLHEYLMRAIGDARQS